MICHATSSNSANYYKFQDSITTEKISNTTTDDTTTLEDTTTTNNFEPEPDDKFYYFITVLSTVIFTFCLLGIFGLLGFVYFRRRCRKTQGGYRPAYLEQNEQRKKQAVSGPYIIPLPQPERLI